MEIFSFAFICIALIGIVIHEIAGRFIPKYQWSIRLFISLCFYFVLAKIRVIFIALSALSIWLGALWLDKMTQDGKTARKAEGLSKDDKKLIKALTTKKKRVLLWSIIIFNLGILIAVKYVMPVLSHSIILPLGISFYTFQALAYIIDIYGEKYEPQTNYGKLLLYLSWFPQLIQGPINRYDLIENDLYKTHRLEWDETREALLLFLFGAIKRYIVGDALAPYVDAILGGQNVDYPGSILLFGAFLFAIEQYANFSGGIDMVMGISSLFGVRLNDNFKQPYFSKNLAQFWRRWHISLGAWMRDYVFYPFAMLKSVQKFTKKISDKFGAHAGRATTGGIGNLIVFALVGLWHGPQLHCLAWGLYNGIIIALSDALAPTFEKMRTVLKIKENSKGFILFQILRTFMIIVFAGFFDVIGSVSLGIKCFVNTFFDFNIAGFMPIIQELYEQNGTSVKTIVVVALALVVMLTWSLLRENHIEPTLMICNFKLPARWAVCYFLMFLLLYAFSVIGAGGGFMYAAF